MCGDLDLSGWPLYHCITAPPPSSLSLTHAAVKSVHPLRGIAVCGAGQGKQHPAEFAYLSAFSNVKAVWNKLSQEYPKNLLLDRQVDRDNVCLLRFFSIDISCFLLCSPTTSLLLFTSFFPLSFSSPSMSLNLYHLDFTLWPHWNQEG